MRCKRSFKLLKKSPSNCRPYFCTWLSLSSNRRDDGRKWEMVESRKREPMHSNLHRENEWDWQAPLIHPLPQHWLIQPYLYHRILGMPRLQHYLTQLSLTIPHQQIYCSIQICWLPSKLRVSWCCAAPQFLWITSISIWTAPSIVKSESYTNAIDMIK